MKQLGLAWYADLDTNRGQEATPLVVDGVMYVSTAWSMVKAFDAKTRPEDLFRLPNIGIHQLGGESRFA